MKKVLFEIEIEDNERIDPNIISKLTTCINVYDEDGEYIHDKFSTIPAKIITNDN